MLYKQSVMERAVKKAIKIDLVIENKLTKKPVGFPTGFLLLKGEEDVCI